MKGPVVLTLVCLLALTGAAHAASVTSFSDGSTAKSLGFISATSFTFYIEIPKSAEVSSATIDISGERVTNPALDVGGDGDSQWEGIGGGDVVFRSSKNGFYDFNGWIAMVPGEGEPMTAYGRGGTTYIHGSENWIGSNINFGINPGILHIYTTQEGYHVYVMPGPAMGEYYRYMYVSSDPSLGIRQDGYYYDYQRGYGTAYSAITDTTPVAGYEDYELKEGSTFETTVPDFSSELSEHLGTCTPDADDNCQIPLVFSSDSEGYIVISNINIQFPDIAPPPTTTPPPETTPAPTTTPPPVSGCGDGTCSSDEDITSCSRDCSLTVRGRLIDRYANEPPYPTRIYVKSAGGNSLGTFYTNLDGTFEYTYDTEEPYLFHLVPTCNEQKLLIFKRESSGEFQAYHDDRECSSYKRYSYSSGGIVDMGDIYLTPASPFNLYSDIPVSFYLNVRKDSSCTTQFGGGNSNVRNEHYSSLSAVPGYSAKLDLTTADGTLISSPWTTLASDYGCSKITAGYIEGEFNFDVCGNSVCAPGETETCSSDCTGDVTPTTTPPPTTYQPPTTPPSWTYQPPTAPPQTYTPQTPYPPRTAYPLPPRVVIVTPPPVTTGEVSISSSPSAASVFINGRYRGTTPYADYRASQGEYTVKITKDGYEDYSTVTKVRPGGAVILSASLKEKRPEKGIISVISDPPGARVYIDGDELGVTPLRVTDVSLTSHVIQLSKKGYKDYFTTADVSTDETYNIVADLTQELIDITNSDLSIQLYSVSDVISLEEESEIILSAVSYIHNTEDMNLQAILKIPSGLAVSSVAFADSGAGQYTAYSVIKPGGMRQISANIVPTNFGEYEIEGELIYYFGDDKSTGDIRRINIPIKVTENEDNDRGVIIKDDPPMVCGPTIISILLLIPLLITRSFFNIRRM